MRLVWMLSLLLGLLVPGAALAQEGADDADFTTWKKGNITFDYPADWSATELEPGLVLASNNPEEAEHLAEMVFGLGYSEALPAETVGFVVVTEQYLLELRNANEFAADFETGADELLRYTALDFAPSDLESDISEGEDGQPRLSASWTYDNRRQEQVIAHHMWVVDGEPGMLALVALSLAENPIPPEVLAQAADSLSYRSPTAPEDLTLDASYSLASLSFDYPAEWYVMEEDLELGLLYLSNLPDLDAVDGPAAGDIAMMLAEAESFAEELGIEGGADAATFIEIFLSFLGDEAEFNQPQEIAAGENTALRADAIVDGELRAMVLVVETPEGKVAVILAATDLETISLYEDVLTQMAASVR